MLASVQAVREILPIPGADNLELAKVNGWQCVVKKGEFKVGDSAIYIQIDTIVPAVEYFDFMERYNYRVKTIKLRGTLSQGLLVPVHALLTKKYRNGADVTKHIGVKKYEKPDTDPVSGKYGRTHMVAKYRKPFPSNRVSRTDEVRVQNCPEVLRQNHCHQFYGTYKMDGSSITIIHDRKWSWLKFRRVSQYRVCSRNLELTVDDGNPFHHAFNTTNTKAVVDRLVAHYKTNDIVIQGEAIGPNFNGNYHELKAPQILLFNIFVDGVKLPPVEMEATCLLLEIPMCPTWGTTKAESVDELLALADVKDPLCPWKPGEGLVFRNSTAGVSFKVVNNKYLLERGE